MRGVAASSSAMPTAPPAQQRLRDAGLAGVKGCWQGYTGRVGALLADLLEQVLASEGVCKAGERPHSSTARGSTCGA